MRIRVLDLDLEGAVEAFSGSRWKFFEVDEAAQQIRVEKPVGSDEAYVVYIRYRDDRHGKLMVERLLDAGFIRQQRKVVCTW